MNATKARHRVADHLERLLRREETGDAGDRWDQAGSILNVSPDGISASAAAWTVILFDGVPEFDLLIGYHAQDILELDDAEADWMLNYRTPRHAILSFLRGEKSNTPYWFATQ